MQASVGRGTVLPLIHNGDVRHDVSVISKTPPRVGLPSPFTTVEPQPERRGCGRALLLRARIAELVAEAARANTTSGVPERMDGAN
ncbi:unnamed protein product [Notodromas monacha]|uniref:Uncharacterized protein n=1 Tax=Notodromas monacha TaxID=399045 RepID=A0A7R9BRB5_9CRUS|nr:unnamed protein product [Notodromas monacha]CAG0920234.1 unnamed protein product [Notodromas monacha]